MPNLMSMKFLRGCFAGYCNFAKSNEGRFAAGDRILGKVLMTIRRPSLQYGHLVRSNPVSLKMRSEAVSGFSASVNCSMSGFSSGTNWKLEKLGKWDSLRNCFLERGLF